MKIMKVKKIMKIMKVKKNKKITVKILRLRKKKYLLRLIYIILEKI